MLRTNQPLTGDFYLRLPDWFYCHEWWWR